MCNITCKMADIGIDTVGSRISCCYYPSVDHIPDQSMFLNAIITLINGHLTQCCIEMRIVDKIFSFLVSYWMSHGVHCHIRPMKSLSVSSLHRLHAAEDLSHFTPSLD